MSSRPANRRNEPPHPAFAGDVEKRMPRIAPAGRAPTKAHGPGLAPSAPRASQIPAPVQPLYREVASPSPHVLRVTMQVADLAAVKARYEEAAKGNSFWRRQRIVVGLSAVAALNVGISLFRFGADLKSQLPPDRVASDLVYLGLFTAAASMLAQRVDDRAGTIRPVPRGPSENGTFRQLIGPGMKELQIGSLALGAALAPVLHFGTGLLRIASAPEIGVDLGCLALFTAAAHLAVRRRKPDPAIKLLGDMGLLKRSKLSRLVGSGMKAFSIMPESLRASLIAVAVAGVGMSHHRKPQHAAFQLTATALFGGSSSVATRAWSRLRSVMLRAPAPSR